MIRRFLLLENRLGLHARAAAKLVRVASEFQCEALLAREDGRQRVDCRSIFGLLMLAARQGTRLELTVRGTDELAADAAIAALFQQKFGEPE